MPGGVLLELTDAFNPELVIYDLQFTICCLTIVPDKEANERFPSPVAGTPN